MYGPSLPVLVRPDDPAVQQSPLGSGMVYPIEHKGVKLLSLGYVSPQVRYLRRRLLAVVSMYFPVPNRLRCTEEWCTRQRFGRQRCRDERTNGWQSGISTVSSNTFVHLLVLPASTNEDSQSQNVFSF